MWTRPVAAEFETWKNEFGIKDWTWEKALPLLSKCETVLSDVHADASFRGHDVKTSHSNPLNMRLTAAQNLNIPLAPRPNDPNSPPSNITRVDFIYDASAPRTDYLLHRISPASLFKNTSKCMMGVSSLPVFSWRRKGLGRRAIMSPPTKKYFAQVVQVSNPQLLQLSGIGPRHLLESHNIPVKVDLPVGETLEDHSMVSVNWTCPKKDTVNAFMSNPLLLIGELFKASGDSADGSKAENIPDIEFLIIPVGTPTPEGKFDAIPNNDGGFAITTSLLRPVGSGRVHITTSSDPRQNPLVDLGSLTVSLKTLSSFRKGVRLALRIGEEIKRLGYPLKDWKRPESLSDDDVDAFIKKNVQSGYHLTSSVSYD
ncbi:hypothetical protein DL96DRAFT_1688654 [Flagelloscypha sp. PMI_526]|nr:hypothetical protein DL96DRAFT_1688654 [Flagelloscypha sp. PMI_526]